VSPGVLVITGPTASGKSRLALALAERFDAEIVEADSRQIYRGMPIGTAAPAPDERARVRHHLVGFLAPDERYSAARFVSDALAAIDDIRARGKRAIVAGGTGFYIRALTGDVALSDVHDEALRERLAREARIHPPLALAEWLAAIAPGRAAAISPNDPYRLTRALEIALGERGSRARTSSTLTASTPAVHEGASSGDVARRETLKSRGIAYRKLLLDVPRDELDHRIAERVDAMLRAGLLDEAERIGAGAVAADAVGYREALAYLDGRSTYEELRRHLIRNTRRYAKRQVTWFRTEPDAQRIDAGGDPIAAAAGAAASLGWSDAR